MAIADEPITARKRWVPDFSVYVCPRCKGALERQDQNLACRQCKRLYPVVDGIADFSVEDLAPALSPILRTAMFFDFLARIYETKLWYPLILRIYGGRDAPSFERLVQTVAGMVESSDGLVLDVACGPGTLGRRIASASRAVYGVDMSWGMLRQGLAYLERDRIANVQFAHARAEALPFRDAMFDAAICGGALHLFADPGAVLGEICRTMKAGALLAVTTFIGGEEGLVRFGAARSFFRRRGFHVFDVPELERYLDEAGFEAFRPLVNGSVLTFSARKQRPAAAADKRV